MADGKLAVARLPPLSGSRPPRDKNRVESLAGKPYRLNGNVHPLPPPRALRPYVDTKAGEVDTWPAHASGLGLSSSAAMLSKNKSLVILSEEDSGKAPIIPKPRFLEQLENFLQKELRALGVTEVAPSDLRLQAHREVFEYLIEDFKTYKPLLAAVKNEYEMMLAYQRQQIRQLEPLKQMLVTVSEQCDQKIMGLRDEERQEVADLKAERMSLYTKISSMANEKKDLQEQVTRLQESLQEEHQKYRDECDARKLLLSDINDLRYQQEDYLASKQTTSEQEVEEDPIMLKIALKKAREDEKAASKRLAEMVANYGDVIPRRDFEALEKKYKELEEQNEATQGDFRKLQAEHNALLDVQKQVTGQRDQFYLELETLKRSSTPRPDWEKCGECVQGGAPRWKELSEGKGSNELVDILLQEMASGGIADSGGAEYFDGQRTDGTRENMADFVYSYLQRRFALETIVVEWGYNLHDACQRYASDSVIGFFWKVLNGEADEEAYHDQLQLIHSILTDLTKADAEQGNQEKLERGLFQSTLEASLTGIDQETLAAVVQAAETELDEKDMQEVDYKNLFTEDDEGKTGPFLDEIKKWVQQKNEDFVNHVKEHLGDTSPVSVDELKQAMLEADRGLDNDTMESYLSWTFSTAAVTADQEPLEQSKLLERLRYANLKQAIKPK